MSDLANLPDEAYVANLLATLVDEERELELHAKFLPHVGHYLACRLSAEDNVVYIECRTCERVLLDLQGDEDQPGDQP